MGRGMLLGALAGAAEGLESDVKIYREDQLAALKQQQELEHEKRIEEAQVRQEGRKEQYDIRAGSRDIENKGLLAQQEIDINTKPENVQRATDAELAKMKGLWPQKLEELKAKAQYTGTPDRNASLRALQMQKLQHEMASPEISKTDKFIIETNLKELKRIDDAETTAMETGESIPTEKKIEWNKQRAALIEENKSIVGKYRSSQTQDEGMSTNDAVSPTELKAAQSAVFQWTGELAPPNATLKELEAIIQKLPKDDAGNFIGVNKQPLPDTPPQQIATPKPKTVLSDAEFETLRAQVEGTPEGPQRNELIKQLQLASVARKNAETGSIIKNTSQTLKSKATGAIESAKQEIGRQLSRQDRLDAYYRTLKTPEERRAFNNMSRKEQDAILDRL